MQTRPQGFVDTPQGRVLLADSEEALFEGGRMFYRTVYGIQRGSMDFASHADYEFGETGGSVGELKLRLEEATVAARLRLKILTKSGYYDNARQHAFSPR